MADKKDERIAELETKLEAANKRVAELESAPRAHLDPHGATAQTASPPFEDLPADHPLKQ